MACRILHWISSERRVSLLDGEGGLEVLSVLPHDIASLNMGIAVVGKKEEVTVELGRYTRYLDEESAYQIRFISV